MDRPLVVLFGGPAGGGKSTLSERWTRSRPVAVRLDLDEIRQMIRGGFVDPQVVSPMQAEQYESCVRAVSMLARSFLGDGYDVAIEDVLEPEKFERLWRPLLDGLPVEIVVIRPSLDETIRRSQAREKRVHEVHTRTQHGATGGWPRAFIADTTGMSVDESLRIVEEILLRQRSP